MINDGMNEFIPQLIVQHLKSNGVDFISSLPKEQDLSINDIIKYCENEAFLNGMFNINFKTLLNEAISFGYDKRYLMNDKVIDERKLFINNFKTTFNNVLTKLNIVDSLNDLSVLVVGIGNGTEGKILYEKIKKLVIVDIAYNSLNQAKKILPHSQAFQARSDMLDFLPDSNFDIYISLRTYQSTYFDIFASLQEAKRVLKNNGSIIISIACGTLNDNGNLIYGIYNPHNGKFDKNRPNLFLESILKYLEELNFNIVGIEKNITEIFIFALKQL